MNCAVFLVEGCVVSHNAAAAFVLLLVGGNKTTQAKDIEKAKSLWEN